MGVKQYKPTSPGRRFQTVSDFADVTSTTPEKSLLAPLPKKAGRNNNGRVTTRHQGGGTKRRYRIIDFKRNKDGIPAKVATIEYDLTAVHVSLFFTMQMVRSATSFIQRASKLAKR